MLIMAHRGYPLVAPENTLSSIRKAINLNPEYLEIDVHLSKDGEIIVSQPRPPAFYKQCSR